MKTFITVGIILGLQTITSNLAFAKPRKVQVMNFPAVTTVEVKAPAKRAEVRIDSTDYTINSISLDVAGSGTRFVSIGLRNQGTPFSDVSVAKLVRFYSSSDAKLEAFYDRIIRLIGEKDFVIRSVSDPLNNGFAYAVSLDTPASGFLFISVDNR